MTKKILFLHGFFASGQCIPALTLQETFEDKAYVLTPDLPIHPNLALPFIREICEKENPNVLVGNSCGSFYAQIIASEIGIPTLLGNPHFRMTEFLEKRIGRHEYKSPRKNGNQEFIIDKPLIDEFAKIEKIQFNNCKSCNKENVWGLFGNQDTLAHFEPLFLNYYKHSFHFPGGHTPTAEEIIKWYVPLINKLLDISTLPC